MGLITWEEDEASVVRRVDRCRIIEGLVRTSTGSILPLLQSR